MTMRLPLLAVSCAIAAGLPAATSAQEAHAGASGYVYVTETDRVRDGILRLDNGATVEATPELARVRGGRDAVLVILQSGCRLWIEEVGLSRCALTAELPDNARRTDAALVWVERVLDGGAAIVLTGASVLQVPSDQAAFADTWNPGEAILIDGARLLHLDHGAEIVDVVRLR
jgi:hypothetical protein